MHNILFIRKLENSINGKISICHLNNIIDIIHKDNFKNLFNKVPTGFF